MPEPSYTTPFTSVGDDVPFEPPALNAQACSSPDTSIGFRMFSNGSSPVWRATRPACAHAASTLKARLAERPVVLPLAVTQCLPGSAEAGTLNVIPPKEPVAPVPARA